MILQAAANCLATINAGAAAMLAPVPDLVTAGAVAVCMGLALRAAARAGVRRFLPGLDCYGERRAKQHGRCWSWMLDREARSLELWAGRFYAVLDLPPRVPVQAVR